MKNPTPPTGTGTLVRARVVGRFHVARTLRQTSRALVKAGHAWASIARCAEAWGVSDECFRQLTTDGDPAIACGDIEALGARLAVPFYERCIARLRLGTAPGERDLRDLAEVAVEHCAALVAGIREAKRDGRMTLDELDDLDARTVAAEADLAAVRAATAWMRESLRVEGAQ